MVNLDLGPFFLEAGKLVGILKSKPENVESSDKIEKQGLKNFALSDYPSIRSIHKCLPI